MNKILAAIVVALVGWLGLAPAAGSVPADPASACPTFTYDSHSCPASLTSTTKERGPPANTYDYAAPGLAVDTLSHGLSARPEPTGSHATYTHNGPTLVASGTRVSGTRQPGAHGDSGPLPALAHSEGAAKTAPINGETAATALGRAMHKSWDYGPGFSKEFTLKAGGRVDALNMQTRHVIELKPNNPRAIRLGERQLDGYIEKLNAQFPGEPWTGSVVTYP